MDTKPSTPSSSFPRAGFGDGVKPGTSTQWSSSLAMAASFDPELAERWGQAMGLEFWSKGTNIQEGPGVNVARIQKNGRTFEYVSGEDPVLGAALRPRIVNGIQQNVMAIVKVCMLARVRTGSGAGAGPPSLLARVRTGSGAGAGPPALRAAAASVLT